MEISNNTPNSEQKKTLYIFIDESGNFDFSVKGTKYFALTAVSTLHPLKSREDFMRKVYELKYKNWCNGEADYFFHATEDKQEIRDWVFATIKNLDDIAVDSIYAQKNKTHPSLYLQYDFKNGGSLGDFKPVRSEERFYDKISQMLLKYIFNRYENNDGIDKIIIVLGSIFTDKKRGYVLQSLKSFLKNNFKKPFFIYFKNSNSDINCQIADYCGWAIYVKIERGEDRPMQEIRGKIKSAFDVFANGTNIFYNF